MNYCLVKTLVLIAKRSRIKRKISDLAFKAKIQLDTFRLLCSRCL